MMEKHEINKPVIPRKRHSEILDLWAKENEDLDSIRWRLSLSEEEAAFVVELDEELADMLEWDCCAAIKPGTNMDLTIRQVAGSMALSGYQLTEDDVNRIRAVWEHLEIDKIEQNFEGFDVFSELMKSLEEALELSKGGTMDEREN